MFSITKGIEDATAPKIDTTDGDRSSSKKVANKCGGAKKNRRMNDRLEMRLRTSTFSSYVRDKRQRRDFEEIFEE